MKEITKSLPCKACGGKSLDPDNNEYVCESCLGLGVIPEEVGLADMIGKEVVLNELEQRMALYYGRAVHYSINVSEYTNVSKKQDNISINVQGAAGEVAFCRLFNLYPFKFFELIDGRKDIGDCELFNRAIVDVKTSSHEHSDIIAYQVNKKIDYYALMLSMGQVHASDNQGVITVDEWYPFVFKGFVSAEELFKNEPQYFTKGNFEDKTRKVWYMPQNRLKELRKVLPREDLHYNYRKSIRIEVEKHLLKEMN